jgi:hypothetical protein
MATRRRSKTDTVASAVDTTQSLQNKAETLCWPEHIVPRSSDAALAESERQIYEFCLGHRNPKDWKPMDLINLARYSGHMAQLIKDEDLLKRSGGLVKSPNNPQQFIRNPLLDVASTRFALADKTAQRLGFVVSDARTLARGGQAASAIEGALNRARDPHSLLA